MIVELFAIMHLLCSMIHVCMHKKETGEYRDGIKSIGKWCVMHISE